MVATNPTWKTAAIACGDIDGTPFTPMSMRAALPAPPPQASPPRPNVLWADQSYRRFSSVSGAGDGNVDVITANTGEDTQLFWGEGDGDFDISTATLDSVIDKRCVADEWGGESCGLVPGQQETVSLFDYDEDGDLDVFIGAFLLTNNGDKTFRSPSSS